MDSFKNVYLRDYRKEVGELYMADLDKSSSRYAEKVRGALAAEGVRVEVDDSAEKLGAKIREASAWKVPYKLVVGPRDEAAGTVSVRKSGEGDLGAMSLADFVEKIRGELAP